MLSQCFTSWIWRAEAFAKPWLKHALTGMATAIGSAQTTSATLQPASSSNAAACSATPASQGAPTKPAASTARKGAQVTAAKRLGLKDVSHIIAVSSAKGGVGKSTTAVNLAVALATSLQLRVGLLDADVHGPSIGKMMSLSGEPPVRQDPGAQPLMVPRENYRVRAMSFSFFVKEGDAVALRGPMVNSAFDRMAFGTDWGPLDVLVVDMPPGTGDAQINLGQRIPLSGAVIVSTPQDIALMDARRGVELYRKLHVPLLGMVENMSCYVCKSCGHHEYIFGEGGAVRTAQELGLRVLGQVPLDIAIRVRSDGGAPVVVSEPASSSAKAYIDIARNVYQALQEGSQGTKGPKISVE